LKIFKMKFLIFFNSNQGFFSELFSFDATLHDFFICLFIQNVLFVLG
jgi:hypothetical protein